MKLQVLVFELCLDGGSSRRWTQLWSKPWYRCVCEMNS